MLKFLRKYNKWLLAVFCVFLMIAFLIPQAAQQFAPNPATATMATTYDGEEITREQLNRVVNEVNLIRRLGLDNVFLPNLSLVPNTGNELDDALAWMLIQRAAEHNGIGASEQAAFNLVASVLDVQNEDELEEEAKKFNAGGRVLIEVGKQYLIAEQYRQLVAGIEFQKPTGADQLASPGLQRLGAISDLNRLINPIAEMYQRNFELPAGQARLAALQQVMMQPDSALQFEQTLSKIVGHPRVTAQQIQYLLQRELTEVDLTVVVLDAEDRVAGITVSDDDVRQTFERYADDAPGTGQPYGLGYRIPDRVQLQALRIPFESVREAVKKDITAEDVRQFYDDNRQAFIDFDDIAAGGDVKPKPLTAVLRDEIRTMLVHQRAQEKAVEIAQAARLRLNEDARGLKDDGPFKVLPKDFKPTPMVEVAGEIEEDFGITPEVIVVDDWVSGQDMLDTARFTQAVFSNTPGSSIPMPSGGLGGDNSVPVPEMILGGRAGLFASVAPEVPNPNDNRRRAVSLAQYINFAKPFVDPDSPQAKLGLQPMLPGRILGDITGSTYVFRITDTDKAHPATDLAPVADKVREDTRRVRAYESLAEEKDALLERALSQSIEILMPTADAKQTLSALTRRDSTGRSAAPIDGLSASQPVLSQAFGVADKLLAQGGLDAADPADRLFVVELPGDYKIAVVRIDAIRPLTRAAFEAQATSPEVVAAAANLEPLRDPETPLPLSLEALQAATNFKWEEGFGPEDLEDEDEQEQE
ncbi:MAG: hypothetical protein ACE37H_14520 [Phycisphaeraceae bacterium]